MNDTFDVSARLKELRKLSGLTQEEFSELSTISYKFYQHIESGRKKLLRVDTIERVCAAYGISLWEFFHPKLPKLKMPAKKAVTSRPHRKKSPALRK